METVLAATLETTKVSVFQYSSFEGVPFTAKVQKAKTRKGKEYYVLRLTIPKDVQHKLHLRADDYVFLYAQRAQWYHLVDWAKMPETVKRLPEGLRKTFEMAKLLPKRFAGQSELQSPVSGAGGVPALAAWTVPSEPTVTEASL